MPRLWLDWLRDERRAGFADLSGARVSLHLPVADAWLNRLIATGTLSTGRVREISVRSLHGNVLRVRVRVAGPAFLPAVYVQLQIVEQPRLPESPVVVLRLTSQGLAFLAGNALTFMNVLPPGITLRDDLLRIDLAVLSRRYALDDLLALLTSLEFTTGNGHLIVDADLAAPAASAAVAGTFTG